ncbi:MAG: FAD-binding protein, partial [Candidatus Marinimicrobia bacterium]|nr:FAD-binding protein [Candidatus Neomarinimicrobiota bacterium]
MPRLASPVTQIKSEYEVVVIGSGYGGSISASRMARAGRSVCLLEKGREFQPGEYPEKEMEASREMQVDLPNKHIGHEGGLYDFRVNEDINVFQGCGLGGTSLVNANVALEAYDWVMKEDEWPSGLLNDEPSLREGFNRAKEMLKPIPYPENWPVPPKLSAMEESAKKSGLGEFYRTPINVTFKDGMNHVGVMQNACTGCGDCVTGCNYASKNTTIMNYLPDARNHGAEIYTGVSVEFLEKKDEKWIVHYRVMDSGQEKFNDDTQFVIADIVMLGAGSLGSTGILMKSRENGLSLSPKLGEHFTGNGDFLGFGYNNDVRAHAIGMGHKEPDPKDPVGPCITGIIDVRNGQEKNKDGMVIEEGVAPGPISAYMTPILEFASHTIGMDTDGGFADFLRETWRKIRSFFGGAYTGAVENTMTYLVMTHDDRNGKLYLKDGRVRIDWEGVGKQSIFKKVSENLRKVTDTLGGTYIKNPTWNKLFRHRLTTVHPLGGCIMGESAEAGVVNHKGQVFSGSYGEEVYENLYVNDGAIVPRTLGVNPLLTISALAERNCKYAADDRGWSLDYSFGEFEQQQETEQKPGLKFTEKMTGYFSTEEKDDFEKAFNAGKKADSEFSFTLTIISDDVETMLEDEKHPARMIGTVTAPALDDEPLTVSNGVFNLFEKDHDRVDTHTMQYRMQLTGEEGQEYYFHG